MSANLKPSEPPFIPWKLNCQLAISKGQVAVSKMQEHATELQDLQGHLLKTAVRQRVGKERGAM